ncbi:AfsR/SARP family transcriptional regulator [Phytohabitans rumicis]|uniref:SARP family transcriptional regulator n=1 Tax=Phytohabitans rumicis TaxID=1076125 RepID=A0A6V8LN56_9ACTN|nr:tetratricopeptide repeat protein [Phytohabitans rumicis]GFJ96069.1 SARP family transcriptional regulator [Phytohabitans rumicis]
MNDVEFRLLGPVGVWRDDRRLGPVTAQQRSLLAMLLLNLDKVVSVERLTTALWGATAPASARNAIQGYVAKLRRLLAEAYPAGVLATSGPGYLLSVDRRDVDLYQFRALVAEAADGGDERAATRLRGALALWRDAALTDVAADWLPATMGPALEEERLGAFEQLMAGELARGRNHECVTELSTAVAEQPFRERLVVLLMTALHRDGRTAEALTLFRDTRRRLVDHFGIEPGDALTGLHRQILADSSGPQAAPHAEPAAVVPRQLPADVGGFVGRQEALGFLDGLLPHPGAERNAPAIVTVVGPAGAGKTTLAVHWAHRAAEHFPDGQLFVDMRGFHTGPRMSPAEALPLVLVTLGVAAERIPVGVAAQTALYRSVLAGRRVLVIVDNVADAEQVRPLIPGEPGCLVVVTSRDRLSGLVALTGAHRLTLDVLAAADAVEVLARAAGPERVGADPEAAVELAKLCGYLPLALRIAGARLADRAHLGVRRHAEELAARGRMAGLRVDGDDTATVRGAFDLSYQALAPPARLVFRLLSLVPAPAGWTTAAVATLAGLTADEAEPLVDALARFHLVKLTAQGRVVCHDLLLEYAAELAVTHERDGAAADRLLHWYLHSVERAATVLNGASRLRLPRDPLPPGVRVADFAGEGEARRWVAAEWPNLTAAVEFAAASGRDRVVWHLADALRDVMRLQASPAQWLSVVQTGLAAAHRAGDVLGQAAMRHSLGFLHWRTADYAAAIEQYEMTATLARRAGWRKGESAALCNGGIALAELGQTRRAIHRMERSLAIDRELGDATGQAVMLTNLAAAYEQVGELSRAARLSELALPLLRQTGRRQGEAVATENLGVVRREQGRPVEAREALERALAISRSIGAGHEEASTLNILGLVHHDTGRYEEAAAAFSAALEIARRLGDSRLEIHAHTGLAAVRIRQCGLEEAAERLDAALDLAHQTSHQRGTIEALLGLADLAVARKEPGGASDRARRALELARASGYVLLSAQAHSRLAAGCLQVDDAAGCLEQCRRAVATQRRAGQRLAFARTLLTMGHAYQRLGKGDLALSQWRRADRLFEQIGAPERADTAALLG